LINLSLVQKGKKMAVRALPLLFQHQLVGVYFTYLRNLALLVSSPRLSMVFRDSIILLIQSIGFGKYQ
jgi:hypothetical protein